MMNETPEQIENLLKEIKYQQFEWAKLTSNWLSSFYTSILTVSSIFIAFSPLIVDDENYCEEIIIKLMLLMCLGSVLTTVFSIKNYHEMNRKMTFRAKNKDEDPIQYFLAYQNEMNKAFELKNSQKWADKLIIICFIGSILMLLLIFLIN